MEKATQASSVISFVLLAAFLARLVVDTDRVVPVGVHESVVAVAERTGAESLLAWAWRLKHAGTTLKGRRAVVVIVGTATAVVMMIVMIISIIMVLVVTALSGDFKGICSSLLGESLFYGLFDQVLDSHCVGGRKEEKCGELALHFVFADCSKFILQFNKAPFNLSAKCFQI